MNSGYFVPRSLEEAQAFVGSSDDKIHFLGDSASRMPLTNDAVIDLKALNLSEIKTNTDKVLVGAMAALEAFCQGEALPYDLVKILGTQFTALMRNSLTVGSLLRAPLTGSPVIAALIAAGAEVIVAGSELPVSVSDWYESPDRSSSLPTALTLPKHFDLIHEQVANSVQSIPSIAVTAARLLDGCTRVVASGSMLKQPVVIFEGFHRADTVDFSYIACSQYIKQPIFQKYVENVLPMICNRVVNRLRMEVTR